MLIGGAALSVLGAWALHAEGAEEAKAAGRQIKGFARFRELILAGAFLVAVSTAQGEFDFGVPQFALALHPTLVMFAAGIALVTARIRIGRGGALGAFAGFLAIRGLLAVLIGPLFGEITPHFPEYLAEALVVEAIGLLYLRGFSAAERPISFGALAGLGIGTIGLAAEWAWSHIWIVNSWPAALLPEGAIAGFIAAVAGGVIGGFVGRCLTPGVERREAIPRPTLAVAGVAAVGVIAFFIPVNAGSHVTAAFNLQIRQTPDGREATGTFRLNPPGAAQNADWFNVTSWQGKDGPAHIDRPQRIGDGVYRITQPIHVDGTWKTTLRLHAGRRLAGMPIFMPADPAIPVAGIPVESHMTRSFELDHQLLQREQKKGVPGFLALVAYLGVGGISFALIFVVGWGLARLNRMGGEPPGAERSGRRQPARRRRTQRRPAPA
jgi:hypothetical protein